MKILSNFIYDLNHLLIIFINFKLIYSWNKMINIMFSLMAPLYKNWNTPTGKIQTPYISKAALCTLRGKKGILEPSKVRTSIEVLISHIEMGQNY